MCLTYLCLKRICCCFGNDSTLDEKQDGLVKPGANEGEGNNTAVYTLHEYDTQEYNDLMYISQKREIKVTVKKGTQAGVIAGLCVMGGVIVAGPVGAAIGGAIGTGAALNIAKDSVGLGQLLEQTPNDKRAEVVTAFRDAIKEEFQEGIHENPELRLLLSGGTILGVMRYALDKDLIESERLDKLDNILQKVSFK